MEKLAIDGGTPAVTGQDTTRRLIGAEERQAVIDLIDRSIAQGLAFDRYGGVEVDAYEKEFAAWLGMKHATAVSAGTAAVHTALGALRLEPGSEVVCSPITDPGAVAPVLWNLCIPVFADTSPESFNVAPESVEKAITKKTAAICVGHIAGDPCEIAEIAEIARRHGLPLVEDCAQSHGATYDGKPAGSFGTLSAWSLMSGKHHTAGGQGGMVVTNSEDLYWMAKRFADRGKAFNLPAAKSNVIMGLNYRMTELEAVIGRVQLRRLPGFVARRRKLAARLAGHLSGLKAFSLGYIPSRGQSAHWFLRIRVHTEHLTVDKAQVAKALSAEGVHAARTYTSLITTQQWFAERKTFGTSGLPWTLPGVRTIDYANSTPNAAKALDQHLICSMNESLSEEYFDMAGKAFAKIEQAYRR